MGLKRRRRACKKEASKLRFETVNKKMESENRLIQVLISHVPVYNAITHWYRIGYSVIYV